MGRTARGRRDAGRLRPIQSIELSWDNFKLRVIAAAVFLAIGVWMLAQAVAGFLGTEPGWQVIKASSGAATNCAGDFTLLYELGAAGMSAAAEKKALVNVYTAAAVTAYRLFNADESFEDVTNIYDLNRHPNEVLTVDGALYEAFGLLARYGDRTVYLGPVYELYDDLFLCQDDWQTEDFDPYVNAEIAAYYAEVAAFANDPEAVDLRLLGDNQVCLYVSGEYLTFAQENETDRFLDFGWLTNAFIADCLAQALIDAGHTHGSISSYDGFIRNLDGRGLDYALNLYDFADGVVRHVGVMHYQGPKGMVYLRDYPLNEGDGWRMYRLETGEVRTSYLSTGDGRCKSAAHDLIACSDGLGCAGIALQIAPIYVADTLNTSALETLAGSGIQSIRVENRVIYSTDAALTLTDLYEGYTVSPD